MLILYLKEANGRESSAYLGGFLNYVTELVLRAKMAQNMSPAQISYAFEQAEAILADIRDHGDPYFWIPPKFED